MSYYDDILNVNAYLRSKMESNAQTSKELIDAYAQSLSDYQEMNEQADDLLDYVKSLAFKKGIDVSSATLAEEDSTKAPEYADFADLLISLPEGYDFSAEFNRLCEEAHAAGFTNVHPEELLTEDEMEHANAIKEELDARFEKETNSTPKDVLILSIAVVVRSLCYAFFHSLHNKRKAADILSPQPSANTSTEGDALPYTIDAAAGVDLDSVLNSSSGASTSNFQIADLLRFLTASNANTARIRNELQILHEQVPFDLPDNSYFKHSDIVGFHPQLGWLIGVINILTNTVTTYNFETFSVVPAIASGLPQEIGPKLSTILHVLLPVIQNCPAQRDSLLAAIVREADVLQISKAPMEDVSAILENTMYFEQQNNTLLNNVSTITDAISFDLQHLIGDTGLTAFLDLLISAVHAIHYNPETDGDCKFYAIRTNKILLLSNILAASANSSLALFTQNINDIDVGGFLMSFLKLVNSTKFWIEIKANYLVSEYKVEIDKQMEMLGQYFTHN